VILRGFEPLYRRPKIVPRLVPLYEDKKVTPELQITVTRIRYKWTRQSGTTPTSSEARLQWDRLFPEPRPILQWDHKTSGDGLSELVRIPAMPTRREPELLLVVDKGFYDGRLAHLQVYAKHGDLYTAEHQRVADLIASERLAEFYSAQGVRHGYLDLRYDSLIVRFTDAQKLHAQERHKAAQRELVGVTGTRGELTEDEVNARLLQTEGKVIDNGRSLRPVDDYQAVPLQVGSKRVNQGLGLENKTDEPIFATPVSPKGAAGEATVVHTGLVQTATGDVGGVECDRDGHRDAGDDRESLLAHGDVAPSITGPRYRLFVARLSPYSLSKICAEQNRAELCLQILNLRSRVRKNDSSRTFLSTAHMKLQRVRSTTCSELLRTHYIGPFVIDTALSYKHELCGRKETFHLFNGQTA
jgi:hypothetical protein